MCLNSWIFSNIISEIILYTCFHLVFKIMGEINNLFIFTSHIYVCNLFAHFANSYIGLSFFIICKDLEGFFLYWET